VFIDHPSPKYATDDIDFSAGGLRIENVLGARRCHKTNRYITSALKTVKAYAVTCLPM
jgi:hypothetical protein